MTFFVSDELKDRVSEQDLAEIYHEEEELDIVVVFHCDKSDAYQCSVSSVEKNTKKKNLILEFDVGANEELIEDLLMRETLPRLELKLLQTNAVLFEDIDVEIQLVQIKKTIERNSYFAKIFIAL